MNVHKCIEFETFCNEKVIDWISGSMPTISHDVHVEADLANLVYFLDIMTLGEHIPQIFIKQLVN